MTINTLHTISGIPVIMAIPARMIMHYYLDRSNYSNLSIRTLVFMPLKYLKPYRAQVADRLIVMKNICNALLPFAAIMLLINLVLGIIIYLN